MALMLVLAPAMKAMGLPELLALYLGAFLGVLSVQLGILYYLGWKRNGRLSLESIVLLRSRVPAGRMLLLVLSLFLWAALVFALLGSLLDGALLPAFRWMPALLTTMTEDFSGLPRSLALIVWGVGFVGSALLAPLVEELYFRGFLMPRMPLPAAGAALANAVLFSLYHFWSPWKALTRIVEVAPKNYAVQKSQSIWVSIATHCLLNSVSIIGALVVSLNQVPISGSVHSRGAGSSVFRRLFCFQPRFRGRPGSVRTNRRSVRNVTGRPPPG